MAKRVSAAEIRRQRESLLKSRSEREPLPADLQRRAERFEPASLDDVTWATVRPMFLAVIASTEVRGSDAFTKRCIALAAFLGWADREGLESSIPTLMRFEVIDTYVRSLSSRNAGSRRSHLRSLARDANPVGVPVSAASYEHVPLKTPYSIAEMAAIRRIALNQPTPAQQRSMCAVVGLARGAGLDSQDFRHLGRSCVDDRDTDGIWVDVQGARPRLVPVRRQWEGLVRSGLEGLGPDSLVIGTSTTRRNIAAKVIEKATILGNAPKIEASRLRTTWLADLLTDNVPLSVVMAVSGLTSARTITEIVHYLDTGADPAVAR